MTSIDFTQELAGLRPALMGFTRRFTYDRDEALDLIQDTLLRALTYQDNYKSGTNLKGWLFIMMRNIFINNYRRQKRMRLTNDPATERKMAALSDEHTFNKPGDTLEFKEILRDIDQLRDDLRTPFHMHVTGYKYHEIADALSIPLGTVKNRIFHARQAVRQQIDL